MKKGTFDLDDLANQLIQMKKIGGISGVLGMLPGVGKIKKQLDAANLDDSIIKRQGAIISSMTKAERKTPKLLNASRKKRVAAGSGTSVQEINKLLKMHRQMADMMKRMGRGKGGLAGMFGGGGMPEMPADMAGQMPQGLPGGMPGQGGMPARLPGLGGGMPGLPKGPMGRKK